MKRLSKKSFIFGLVAFFCLTFVFYSLPAKALSPQVRQVRTADNPAVYFLSHTTHRKKAYLSADIYLNYGNKWSDVNFISAAELNSWPEVKLIKTANSPAVFYIKGNQKTLIASWDDMEAYALETEPIITVSNLELNQYQEVSNNDLNLKKTESNQVPELSLPREEGSLYVYNDLVNGTNLNTILTGAKGNLLGSFRLYSPEKTATIAAITFDFGGLYSDPVLDTVHVFDENNSEYNASVSVNQSLRQAIVSFREPVVISQGAEKTIKVFLDMAAYNSQNQTIRVELRQASNIVSNLTSVAQSASFPLRGTEFKIINGANFLGQVNSKEESIAASWQNVSTGSRLIGKFTLTEDSGQEEVTVKNLIFVNNGSAGKNDWEDFRLFNNGQVIARASELNAGHDIEFNINYLRLKKGTPAVLTIIASLKTDRNIQATVNLRLDSISAVGKTYNSSIATQISNFDESFVLN
jgi:hypothetical protein